MDSRKSENEDQEMNNSDGEWMVKLTSSDLLGFFLMAYEMFTSPVILLDHALLSIFQITIPLIITRSTLI